VFEQAKFSSALFSATAWWEAWFWKRCTPQSTYDSNYVIELVRKMSPEEIRCLTSG
jgi:hypothetical protein